MSVNVGTSFVGKNTAAEAAARKRAAAMVTSISNETRAALRAVLVRSIRDGVAPIEAGRLIRSLIGLNVQQAHAAMNYRESLINLGHTPEKVNQLLDRYVAKAIRTRALTIARTETMKALNSGMEAEWLAAREQGLLGPDAMKEWLTTPSEETCDRCSPMDGVRVPLGQPFDVGGPPLHPRCKCTTVLVVPGKKPKKSA